MRFYEIIRESKIDDIAKLNNIRNVNKIFVGQKLKLPDGTEYTVARGDTLGAIASGRFKGTPPVQKTQAKVEPQTQKQQQMIQTQRDAEDQSLSRLSVDEPIPTNVIRSADGTPVKTGTGGYWTSGAPVSDPEKIKAAKEKLTPSQLKWLGDSDPTSPAIMARMPKPLPSEVSSKTPSLIKTKPNNVRIAGTNVNITDTDDDLLTRFYTAAAEYGKPVTINSAARSDQKQAELWVRGEILKEPGVFTPAKPKNDQTIVYKGKTYNVKGSGRGSTHLVGAALDITPAPNKNFVGTEFEQILNKYGLYFPYPVNDPVHIEIRKA